MWTQWIRCPVNQRGEVDTSQLRQIPPNAAGVYAIATKTTGFWSGDRYHIHYVGRTKRSMRDRLKKPLRQHQNGSQSVRAPLLNLQGGRDLPPGRTKDTFEGLFSVPPITIKIFV